jgi:hypothetical protein
MDSKEDPPLAKDGLKEVGDLWLQVLPYTPSAIGLV